MTEPLIEPKVEENPQSELVKRFLDASSKIDKVEDIDTIRSKRENLVTDIGSYAHEEWRKAWIEGHPIEGSDDHEPRWKITHDFKWIERNRTRAYFKSEEADGGPQERSSLYYVDIAHASFEELPLDWQGENRKAAEFILDYLVHAKTNKETLNEAFLEKAAEAVHDAWIERNPQAVAKNPTLKKPYYEISEEEKDKDRRHVVLALEECAKLGHDKNHTSPQV